ncbi:anti-sigma factor domain-containing protein [Geochorda subterranea]|uniref:Anti-sigma factor domain-containing protein n=1 Tax=Geochorda subterranea TaxID=3109564 RepID=A0ABZ1BLP0_9FIRM|nr:anti-sigma factor domain-containing protein [Limnochorda sp. LNt]WRP13503.1 anti-sigma factor domain-containing protein [Limnochorda sp. LNt]
MRGLVLERLGEERAVLLTSDGQFVRVRLRGGASPGDEAWGEPDVRMWEGLRAALGGWQRRRR